MEGRVAILLLLLVWKNIFLHFGKFGDLLREENGQYKYFICARVCVRVRACIYFITCWTLSIVRLIRCKICLLFLMNAFNILIEFLIVTFLVVYWLAY